MPALNPENESFLSACAAGGITAMKHGVVLCVGGSDSGGGAGIGADARTVRELGGFAVVAVTVVTAQNLHAVHAVEAVSSRMIAAQIAAVAADFEIGAVKVGLLPGAEAVRAVARELAKLRNVPVVVDPVLGSTSGTRFLDRRGVMVLKEALFPLATVITPNWPEAAELTGRKVTSVAEAEWAATALLNLGCAAVLAKGGHGAGKVLTDVLVDRRGAVRMMGTRIKTPNTHGTGCVLSSAIAAGLAEGRTLAKAVGAARSLLRGALKAGRRVEWGGRGPALG
jgi:hydroxymethylpyrimidine/phosphomethylpyrimidine kinase